MLKFLRQTAGLALLLSAPLPALAAFGLDEVAGQARALAEEPYRNPGEKLPQALLDLSYDQYRDIRFKPERSLWRGTALPFELQFFHPGLYYTQTVKINLITSAGVREVEFRPENFDYGRNSLDPESLRGLGYAGFRVHYPLNNPEYKDEVIVFLGASYFRALGRGQLYGLSARGLAIDTGLLSGEEFPAFREFWIEWPRSKDKALTIYALLDSRRVTGAYRFTLHPGEASELEVQSRVYLREEVGKLGIAPLTSMYFFGENQPAQHEDYRPEVHDSDGLMIQTDQEWVWRPLVNPRRLLVTSFSAQNPRGFGLMQRDRLFARYEDLEARYEQRPSAWVKPKGDWGAGRVELLLLPTPDETNDNVVAYWVPDQLPAPGEPLAFDYTLSWQKTNETTPPLARVVQTRRGHGYVKEADDSILFHVDFEGGMLPTFPPDAKLYAGVWVGDNGELIERNAFRNAATGGWRTTLRIRREDPTKPVELRALLRRDQETVSETWSYILPGEPR